MFKELIYKSLAKPLVTWLAGGSCVKRFIMEVSNMTSNQLAYQANKETARSNRAKEEHNRKVLAETARHNVASLGEASRHNRAIEEYNTASLNELARHNQAQESIGWYNATETRRAHQAQESIGWYNATETRRANQAREAETRRANQAREAETYRHNYESEAAVGRTQRIQGYSAQEQRRHNLAVEQITGAGQWMNLVSGLGGSAIRAGLLGGLS